jgi:hypothetical protein
MAANGNMTSKGVGRLSHAIKIKVFTIQLPVLCSFLLSLSHLSDSFEVSVVSTKRTEKRLFMPIENDGL